MNQTNRTTQPRTKKVSVSRTLCGLSVLCVRHFPVDSSRKERKGRKERTELGNNPAAFFRHSIGDTLNAVFEPDFSEVDQQSESPVAQSQLRKNLLAVNPNELLHGFQFYDDLALNQQIGAETLIESEFVVANRDGYLSFDVKSLLAEFVGEDDFINAFEQARPGGCVNLESRIKNDLGQLIFIKRSFGICIHRRQTCAGQKCLSRIASRKGHKDRKGFGCVQEGRRISEKLHSPFASFASFA